MNLFYDATVPKTVDNQLDICKFVCPNFSSGTTGLKGKQLGERILANIKEILTVNLTRLFHACHTFKWLDNEKLYVQVLEDSLDHLLYTAKTIDLIKNRFLNCGDKFKAEKLTKVYYKAVEVENLKRPLIGVKLGWGDYLNQRIVEIGASYESLKNWSLKLDTLRSGPIL